jgi:hypothetical protein
MCVFFTAAHHGFRRPLREGGIFVPLVPNVDCYGCQIDNPSSQNGQYCRRGDNICVNRFDAEDAARKILAVLSTKSRVPDIGGAEVA